MTHSRRSFLVSGAALPLSAQLNPHSGTIRALWIDLLERVAQPVLKSLSAGKLKALMPVEAPHGNQADRAQFTYLEAFGRLLSGIAPWLELDQGAEPLSDMARASLEAAVTPGSPDFMNFDQGAQPVVDAAFLALGLMRAPTQLWSKVDAGTKQMVLQALRRTRKIRPGFSNWLLFSAVIEAFFCSVGEDWDAMRVDYAVRQHEEWYKGDGIYGDGANFHWDYYNSFVIQPMLLAVLDNVKPKDSSTDAWQPLRPLIMKRARRYAEIQERLIAPDGSFPAVGRSLAYRCGAFHHLATMALRQDLPSALKPAQARAALTAVMQRCLTAPGTFDEAGWLNIGLCGHQPSIAEVYISTGSCYLCSAAFLPLGLEPDAEFWTAIRQELTSSQIWSGRDAQADHALD
jgi:hypothetical protein